MINQRQLLKVLVSLSFLWLATCGDANTISSKVNVSITPKSPVVILADLTLDPGSSTEKKITAPWYGVTFSVTNNSTETITIQALTFKTIAVTKAGTTTQKIVSTDAADYDNDVYLLEIPAGTSADFSSISADRLIYVDGNEKSVFSYNYLVEVTVQGWVGAHNAPTDRLTKIVTFMTR